MSKWGASLFDAGKGSRSRQTGQLCPWQFGYRRLQDVLVHVLFALGASSSASPPPGSLAAQWFDGGGGERDCHAVLARSA
jgi:hypothetical protein